MGLVEWVCRTLCKKEIARAAERVRAAQEEEIASMKDEAVRMVQPEKIRAHAADALERITGIGLVALVLSMFGCASFGQLDPRAQRAADVFECYVAAVEPYLGGALDAAEVVQDAVQGRASLPQALALLGATADDLKAIDAAMAACRAPVAQPVNPRSLAFREPPVDL